MEPLNNRKVQQENVLIRPKRQLKSQKQMQSQKGVSNTENTTKVIKRYQNRKLYDTQKSRYVTLDDIARMIRDQVHLVIVDNKTKADITASTLIQIIFDAEKKSDMYAPLSVLYEIIQTGNGSMSSYLAKLDIFDPKKEAPVQEYVYDLIAEKGPRSYDNNKSSLLGEVHTPNDHQEATILTPGHQNHLEKITPLTNNSTHPLDNNLGT